MTIKVTNMLSMVFISCAVKEYTSQNGSKGLSYSLSVESNGEVGTLPCTKDVYDFLAGAEKYKKILVVGEYNTSYKNMRIIDVKVDA